MTTPDQATPKKKRGPKPQNPEHGALSVTERAKRRRERVAAAVALAFAEFPLVPAAAAPMSELLAVLTESARRIESNPGDKQAMDVARMVMNSLADKLGLSDPADFDVTFEVADGEAA